MSTGRERREPYNGPSETADKKITSCFLEMVGALNLNDGPVMYDPFRHFLNGLDSILTAPCKCTH